MKKIYFTFTILILLILGGFGYFHVLHQDKVNLCHKIISNNPEDIYSCKHLSQKDLNLQARYDLFYRNAQFYLEYKKTPYVPFVFDFISLYGECKQFSSNCNTHDNHVFVNLMAQCSLEENNVCITSYLNEQKSTPSLISEGVLKTLNMFLKHQLARNDFEACDEYADTIKQLNNQQKQYFDSTIIKYCLKQK